MKVENPLDKDLQAMHRGEYQPPTAEEIEAETNNMFKDLFERMEKMREHEERVRHINVGSY